MKSIHRILRLLPMVGTLLVASCIILVWLVRIDRSIEAGGIIEVEQFELVRPRIGGLITKVLVRSGEFVRVGQILMELEDRDLSTEIAALTSDAAETDATREGARRGRAVLTESIYPLEVEKQRSELERTSLQSRRQAAHVEELKVEQEAARERYRRMQALTRDGLISQEAVDQAHYLELQAELRLHQSQIEEDEKRVDLESDRNQKILLEAEHRRSLAEVETTMRELEQKSARLAARLAELKRLQDLQVVRAGMDGVVVSLPLAKLIQRKVEAGEEILSLMNPESISFTALVSEESVVKVRPGQTALVEMKALPKRKFGNFRGIVVEVSHTPGEKREGLAVSYYPVRIRLETPWIYQEGRKVYLRDGMQGSAEIVYEGQVRLLRALFDVLVGR